MSAPALQLHQVARTFRDGTRAVTVLDGVDLAVDPGEIVVLLGRSGSGKTTLFTVAAGFDQPDAGTVRWTGEAASSAPPPWGTVAVVPQSLGLLEELTVAENVALPARLAGTDDVDVAPLLEALAIGHLADRLPGEVSLGEQQRTAVARAAISRPRVLLADEPVSHQNDALAAVVLDGLVGLARAGTACVVATHDTAVIDVADRVLELRAGRLAAAGAVVRDGPSERRLEA